MAVNPWWSVPGDTLARYTPDPSREPAGRHADRRSAPGPAGTYEAPRHARQEPERGAEPDEASAAPVLTAYRWPALADIATGAGTASYDAWIATHRRAVQASIEASSEAGEANITAAVRRLVAQRRALARDFARAEMGPAVGSVAAGTVADHALHGTVRDEGSDGPEARDAAADTTEIPAVPLS